MRANICSPYAFMFASNCIHLTNGPHKLSEKAPKPAPKWDPQADRRQYQRVELSLVGRFLGTSDNEHSCKVKNISAGGALLESDAIPQIGEQLIIYLDQLGRFTGNVVRIDDGAFAVQFTHSRPKAQRTSDAIMKLMHNKDSVPFTERSAPRVAQDQATQITLESGQKLVCSIVDISLTGASIAITPRPKTGTRLILGKTAAKVVRHHETGVGLLFLGPASNMARTFENVSDCAPLASNPRKIRENGTGIASTKTKSDHSAASALRRAPDSGTSTPGADDTSFEG